MKVRASRRRSESARTARRGFTLIEVLVTMVIVAILAAIAIPSYVQYVNRGRRADARGVLELAAQWQQNFFRETNAYSAALPAGLTTSPSGGGPPMYNIAVTQPGGAVTFTLTATPVAGGPMAGDECGVLSIDQTGLRAIDDGSGPVSSGALFDRCWGR